MRNRNKSLNGWEKLQKVLGIDTVEELEKLDSDILKERIANAAQAMQAVRDELEANPKYQELKENLKALTSGKKEVDKRQKAIIKFCLHLLESKGN